MKRYIVSFSGAVDFEAESEEEAKKLFMELSDEEIGAAVSEYDEISESSTP